MLRILFYSVICAGALQAQTSFFAVKPESLLPKLSLTEAFEKALHEREYPAKKVSFDDITYALGVDGVRFQKKETKGSIETLATIIMNLKQKQMMVRDGEEKEFVLYYFR